MDYTQELKTVRDQLPKFTCTEDALTFGLQATTVEKAALEWRMFESRMVATLHKACRNLDLAMKYATDAQFDHEALQAHDIQRREG